MCWPHLKANWSENFRRMLKMLFFYECWKWKCHMTTSVIWIWVNIFMSIEICRFICIAAVSKLLGSGALHCFPMVAYDGLRDQIDKLCFESIAICKSEWGNINTYWGYCFCFALFYVMPLLIFFFFFDTCNRACLLTHTSHHILLQVIEGQSS